MAALLASVVLGLWMLAAPYLLGIALALSPLVADHGALWFEPIVTGAATALLAIIPQSESHRFGGGWRSLIGGRDER